MIAGPPLDAATFAEVRRRTIFDCCKWDPQVEDDAVLAPFPLVLDRGEWQTLASAAERLAAETVDAERELVTRPELMAELGIPWGLRRLCRRGAGPAIARVMRFDFHPTDEGWRISEANTDVPGGFTEASGFGRLMAAHYRDLALSGDPAGALADALVRVAGAAPTVGFVHATAYTDDRQVMIYLGRRLAERGGRALLLSPADVLWRDRRAHAGDGTPLDALMRFFPAEWLPNLRRRTGWPHFFAGATTPISNPATALVTQSKRFPLAWPRLTTPLPTWRALLPETRAPDEVPWSGGDWVLKPVFGRVGADIGLFGVTPAREWDVIARSVRRWRTGWAAQRRFHLTPVATDHGPRFACVGVYTVDGAAAGAYGRVSRGPIIDHRACDAAVLVAERGSA